MPSTDQNLTRLRVTQLIQELLKRDNYKELAEKIAEANGHSGTRKVDRRKLSDLDHGVDKDLSFDELDALNRFLIQERGVGLGSIFPTPTITEALTAKGKVTLLLGAKHRQGRTAVSVWDFRCMEWMVRRIYRAAPMTQVDFLDVTLPLRDAIGLPPSRLENSEFEEWQARLDDPNGPSFICFGTQRACRATEVLLRKMFDIDLSAPVRWEKTRLPFAFIWSQTQPDEYHSSFCTCPSVINESQWQVDPKDWRTWGIHLREEVSLSALGSNTKTLKVQHSTLKGTSFGVIVAQRRPHGQLWLVLAGLSGPETFAGAKVVDSVVKALPACVGHSAPVLWALFEANVQWTPYETTGDNRSLLSQRLLLQEYWQ